ncbi:MAG: TRM11 family SAM-dependent methyltransferase [Nanobdellota archaeon]
MILVLSKQDVHLARSEAEALLGPGELFDNLLMVPGTTPRPLAYTREFHQLLFACSPTALSDELTHYPWHQTIQGTYKVVGPRPCAGIIWHQLTNPKVDLTVPDTEIHIMGTDPVFVTRLMKRNTEDFEARKPQFRPESLPISLHPKLARCMVNLTGCRHGTIFDPCCGTGGILIEAGLSNRRISGSDIDQTMLQRCSANLRHYGLSANLKRKDIRTINRKYRYIVSDLPYARNTKKIELEQFYKQVAKTLERILLKKAVIAIPHHISFHISNALRIESSHIYYLHKTLSKKILLIQAQNRS